MSSFAETLQEIKNQNKLN